MPSRQPRWPSIGLNSWSCSTRFFASLKGSPIFFARSFSVASSCGTNSCSGGSSVRIVTGYPFIARQIEQRRERALVKLLGLRDLLLQLLHALLRLFQLVAGSLRRVGLGRGQLHFERLEFARREDHLTHAVNAVALEEHMLGAAQPDAFGAEAARDFRILRRIGVSAHAEFAEFVDPLHQPAEAATDFRLDERNLTVDHAPGRTVERDEFAFL